MIGLVAATAAGSAAARRLAVAWPERTRRYDEGPVRTALARAFEDCDQLVCFLATGATVRLLAPLLRGKATDPGVVCVDEAGRFAVALLGGHGGGANELASEVAGLLGDGCTPVVTTATDAVGIPGLDSVGWPAEGAVAAVTRAILDGAPVALRADATWPLPALPPHVGVSGVATDVRLYVTDRRLPLAAREAVLRPPSLVVGVGASRGAGVDEVLGVIEDALDDAGLSPRSVTALATVDAKAGEPGLLAAAERLGVPLRTFPAAELAAVDVPTPSAAPLAAVGTPSVAEAAALTGAGPGAELLVRKRKSTPAGRPADHHADSLPGRGTGTVADQPAGSAAERPRRPAMATCAVARRRPRGRLAVVGLGPGARDLLTPRARAELRRASVIVGLDQYVAQIRDLLRPGTRVLASGLGAEEERARTAVAEARAGRAVALVGSGDAGVYAMAAPALAEAGADIDVAGVPGVTAALAAAALLGAPLGHDHVSVSLSDLHTPWEVIARRVRAAAESDLVVTFYNPRSRARTRQLPEALALLATHRAPTTPVGVVRNASRPEEHVLLTTLAELDPGTVDMMTVVTVGNSATREIAGRMVTPRGYRWQT